MAFIPVKFPHKVYKVQARPVDVAHLAYLVPGVLVYNTKYDYLTGARSWTKGYSQPSTATVYCPANGAKYLEKHLDSSNIAYTSNAPTKFKLDPIPFDKSSDEYKQVLTVGRNAVQASSVLSDFVKDNASDFQCFLAGLVVLGWLSILLNWKAGAGKTWGAVIASTFVKGPKVFCGPSKVRPGWKSEVKLVTLIKEITGRDPFMCMPKSAGIGPDQLVAYLEECELTNTDPYIIVGQEYLAYWADIIKSCNPTVLVFDEIDLIAATKRKTAQYNSDGSVQFNKKRSDKNKRKIRGVSAEELAHLDSVKLRLGLTATPLYDGVPEKFWPITNLLIPGGFGLGFYQYGGRYCGGTQGEYGVEHLKATNVNELKWRSTFLLHRVSAEEAFQGLPETSYRLLKVRKEDQVKGIRYNDEFTYNQALRACGKRSDLPPAHELRMAYSCELARSAVIDEAITTLSSGQRCCIMVERATQAREWAEKIEWHLKRRMPKGVTLPSVFAIVGEDMTPEQRYNTIRLYNEDPLGSCIVGTRQAIGQGVDGLQNTHKGIMAMIPPNAAWYEQAIGRWRRKGQKIRNEIITVVVEGTNTETQLVKLGKGLKLFADFYQDDSFLTVADALEEDSVEDAVGSLLANIF